MLEQHNRMLVQLLDYYLYVSYQPGQMMHLSDALSRLPSHNKMQGKTIKNLDVSIHRTEELTGFNTMSVEKLHQHTLKDSTLQALIQHINDGFPDSSIKCSNCIKSYYNFREELSAMAWF